MSVAAIISRYSSMSPDEVLVYSDGSIDDIESAILFVLATWSGQSITAFKKLTEWLANASVAPTLIVCDIDNLSVDTRKTFGNLRGFGETFWIRHGQVVASMRDYSVDDWSGSIERNSEMLRMP